MSRTMKRRCRRCGKPIPLSKGTGDNCSDCDHRFTLQNATPKPKPATFDNAKATQRTLIDGLDCLPGQQDLF
jgi:DNA-directed RNA polymerase subunit RPC12/RpoP